MNHSSKLSNGRAVIPAALRDRLDIHDGDQLEWSVRGDELVATTQRARLRRAQDLVSQFVPAGSSLVDELLADRLEAQRKEDRRP